MRYRNLFIICLFLSLSTSNARNANNTDCSNVTAETAKMKAEAFLSRKFSSMTRGENRELQLARRDAGYYAFNIGNDEGYIIVSGDERTNDIIGYSYHGHFDLSEMPYSLRRWMRGYSHVIQNLSKNATRAEHKNRPAIETLIKTHWGQNGVYGRQCPRVKNPDDPNSPEYETPAGCVATAMAQIINFSSGLKHFQNYQNIQQELSIFSAQLYLLPQSTTTSFVPYTGGKTTTSL